ncbi:calcium/calmodulin-dependent protein kinase type 1 [Pelomyxa schiedti]|nr:calcium/calmodulin-dependent protein kinase type 1 [Pelomyxa schiedti]
MQHGFKKPRRATSGGGSGSTYSSHDGVVMGPAVALPNVAVTAASANGVSSSGGGAFLSTQTAASSSPSTRPSSPSLPGMLPPPSPSLSPSLSSSLQQQQTQQQQQAQQSTPTATQSSASTIGVVVTSANANDPFIFTREEVKRRCDVREIYEICETLGYGSSGKVVRAIHRKTRNEYAVKIIKKGDLLPVNSPNISARRRARLRSEFEVMSECRHRNIASLVEVIESEKEICFVQQLMRGGELLGRLLEKKRFSEEETRRVMRSVLSALQYMHKKGVVHRDLKLENVVYESNQADSRICVVDLGLARFTDTDEHLHTPCGSSPYVSPELAGLVLSNNATQYYQRGLPLNNNQYYQKGVDMWSCGVIMYTLLAGYPPFQADKNDELLEQIMEGFFYFHENPWSSISREARELILHMLEKDASRRFTADEALKHPWMRTHQNTAVTPIVTAPPSSCTSTTQQENTETGTLSSSLGDEQDQASSELGSKSEIWDPEKLRHQLNLSIQLQRDRMESLKSPSESTIALRRKAKKAAVANTKDKDDPPGSTE